MDEKKLRAKAQAAYWSAKARCNNPNVKCYKSYGAKGIKCLFNGSQDMIDHMGLPPSMNHTIDRIDSSKHYEPGNVRWADMRDQSNNRSSNHFVEIDGVRKTLAQWGRECGISDRALYLRIVRRGWDPKDAITLPIGTVYKVFLRNKNKG